MIINMNCRIRQAGPLYPILYNTHQNNAMKKSIFLLIVFLATALNAIAQKGPNWNLPGANDRNTGIHPPQNTGGNTPPSTPPNNQRPPAYPPPGPTTPQVQLTSSTWQFQGQDVFGFYVLTVRYFSNNVLHMWCNRNSNPQPWFFSTTWQQYGNSLVHSNCGWLSQGTFYLDNFKQTMTFYPNGSPYPIFFKRIG